MLELIVVPKSDPLLRADMAVHYSQPKGFVGRSIIYEIRYNGIRYGAIGGGQTLGLRTIGVGSGSLLPTPTTVGNEFCPSMQKHPSHRRLTQKIKNVNGGIQLWIREWMMGWPIGWTALEPLGTDKYQEWLQWHGEF
jgi:hypothetical protein